MADNTRTQNSMKNMKYGAIYKVASLFLSLVGRNIFLNILPIEYLGINSVFADVLVMLSLADMGLATAMAYSFYKPLAEKDEEKLVALMTFYRKIYHAIAAIVTVVGLMIVPFLEDIIHVEQEIEHLELYYLISLFNTVVSYLFAYKQSIITADQKYYVILKYAMWIAFAKIIFQTIMLYISHSYTLYLCVGIITTVTYNLLVNHQANKYYPFINKRGNLPEKEKKDIFANLKSVFLYKISDVLMCGTDNALISILVNTVAVGLYTNYLTIINRIVQFAGIFFNSITASVGNLIAKDCKERAYEIFKQMLLCSIWLAGFIVIAVYILIEDFIGIWLGKEYIDSGILLLMILCNIFYDIIKQPLLSFREATGMYKKVRYIMLICAIINIVLSIAFGMLWGTVGIVGASFIAKMVTIFWYEAKILYRDYFEKPIRGYFVQVFEGVLFCIITGCVCGKVMQYIEIESWLQWMLKAVICCIVVNVLYLLRYGWTKEFKMLLSRVLKK